MPRIARWFPATAQLSCLDFGQHSVSWCQTVLTANIDFHPAKNLLGYTSISYVSMGVAGGLDLWNRRTPRRLDRRTRLKSTHTVRSRTIKSSIRISATAPSTAENYREHCEQKYTTNVNRHRINGLDSLSEAFCYTLRQCDYIMRLTTQVIFKKMTCTLRCIPALLSRGSMSK